MTKEKETGMKSTYHICAACFRYVVPFQLTGSFAAACETVEGGQPQSIWQRRVVSSKGPESDLYDYIKNELRFENETDPPGEERIGCEWTHRQGVTAKRKKARALAHLLYFPNGITGKDTTLPACREVSIADAGLVLYRNGLGFLWYELSLPLDEMNAEEVKLFQNKGKELNRRTRTCLWQKCTDRPGIGAVLGQNAAGETMYITPFSLGMWIKDLLEPVGVHFLASRAAAYESMMKSSMDGLASLANEKIVAEPYVAAKYRENEAPDKAILFTYAALIPEAMQNAADGAENEELAAIPEEGMQQDDMPQGTGDEADDVRERETLAYHLTNAYKDSYHFSSEILQEMKRPFDRVLWYATKEGAAYLAWPEQDNRRVFETVIPGKIRGDYFTLYLKTLYQSFALLLYAQQIQREIPAAHVTPITESQNTKITELFEEINLFLTKSMATSVSHIHHQSEFYIYLKKQLHVHDDVKSVTAGLNALEALQKEQRRREENERLTREWQAEQQRDREEQAERQRQEDREKESDAKIQAIMGLFALLGISSAFVDCFDFIGKFSAGGEWSQMDTATRWIEGGFFAVIGIISVVAAIFAVLAIIDAWRKKK